MPPTEKPAPHDPVETSVSRREFARKAALGAAGLLAYPGLDQGTSSAAVPSHEPVAADTVNSQQPAQAPPQSPTSAPKLSPQSQAEADFRFQAILNQYPDRFSEAQKTDLRRLCVVLQPPLDHLRAYPISNGELPALYLKPLVDRDKKPAPPASASAKPSAPNPTAVAPKPPKTEKP
jgi:hypothetical protein